MSAAANTRATATAWNPPWRLPVLFAIDPIIDKEKKEPRLPKELMNASADAAERVSEHHLAALEDGEQRPQGLPEQGAWRATGWKHGDPIPADWPPPGQQDSDVDAASADGS